MAGVSITYGTDSGYPKELRDADWQKKKGKIGKLKKTGLGAELKKGEAMVKKIDPTVLDPGANPIKSLDDIPPRVEAAKAHYKSHVQPLMDHMKVISKTAREAEASLKKMPGGSSAAKAAAAVADAADKHAVTLKSLDLEASVERVKKDLEKKLQLAEKNLKASLVKLGTGIKAFMADPSVEAWGEHIKQQGRSVSNCIAILPGHKEKFWKKWQGDFKGFDEGALGISATDPKVNDKMIAYVKNCAGQLKQIAAYKG
jgi:hypothetical protein